MKKLNTILLLSLFFICLVSFSYSQSRFMKDPDVNKDKIVFSYEGDLWLASTSGGTAARLTSAPGSENSPKFSPDGNTIAFTGNYDGSNNVYTIPVTGGEPQRVTYIPYISQTMTWTPDGKRIVFESYYDSYIIRDPMLYFVDKNGSAPEKLPVDRGRHCSFSPDGSKMVYVRKGPEEYNWKRYKGGWHSDIWMYDSKENKFSPLSDYVGKNAYPMWIGDFMYFVSDRTNGIANIYKENLSTKEITQVTNYSDVDVMMPSNDKDQIVYMHSGYLNLLDTKTDQSRQIEVNIPSDRWELRDKTINPKDYIHYVNISNDGKSVVLEAGEIYSTFLLKKGTQ